MLQMLQLRKLNGLLIKQAKNNDSQQMPENLVEILFSDSELDKDLKLVA